MRQDRGSYAAVDSASIADCGPTARRPHGQLFVVLTGFMGTGKTATGHALARMLGLFFVDLDEFIEVREGRSVRDIFEQSGETHFRRLEAQACQKLAERDDVVLATGGGTLLSGANRTILSAKGPTFLLTAGVDAILDRIEGGESRPLLQGDGSLRQRVLRLLEKREGIYRRIERRLDTTDLTPVAAAGRIAAMLDVPATGIDIRFGDSGQVRATGGQPRNDAGHRQPAASGTRIEIGCGLLSQLGRRIAAIGPQANVFLLVPRCISDLYRDQIAASLEAGGIGWREIPVLDGDPDKNFERAGAVIDRLAAGGATRDSLIVTVGGGVTSDIGGFVASIYMRGVSLIHVPTTLLAQVDAAIGGKTGVNSPRAKNLIGSFHHPRLVLSDPCTLQTLPDREIANGMAEVVKTAIIGSPDLFEFIERKLSGHEPADLRDTAFLERCVTACAAVKAAIVQKDPFDHKERRVLNLGHTVGHALEAAANYTELSHGQAVAIGLVAALHLAEARGCADPDLRPRTENILRLCGLPTTAPSVPASPLMKSLDLDKKKKAGRLNFVLPRRLGDTVIVDDVSENELLHAIGKVVK